MTIEKLVKQFTGQGATCVRSDTGNTVRMRPWNLTIPTRIARAVGDVIMLGTIKNAWYSGEKQTYTLETTTGRIIRATADHPFLMADGQWKKLSQIEVGDIVQVNGGRSKPKGSSGFNKQYQTTNTRYHPHQVHSGSHRFSVPIHRLVIESVWNNLPFHDYLYYLRSDRKRCEEFRYLTPDQIVHHKNEDPTDNRVDNLEVLDSIKEHSERHTWGNNVLYQVGYEEIASIESFGVEPTYDIEMVSEPHNFLANGFAVHNSGKTTTLVCGLQVLMGQPPTNARGEVLTPSPQQQAVWDAIALSRGKVHSVGFCAFNKSIADELKARVPPGVDAMTMHSLGFKAVRQSFALRPGRDAVADNDGRIKGIIEELTGRSLRDLYKEKPVLIQATVQLVNLCKMNLVGFVDFKWSTNDHDWNTELSQLASHYDVETNGSRAEIFGLVPRCLERCKDVAKDGQVDYADMIWLPVVLNLPVQRYDLLLTDECQDLNACQQELAFRAGKRLIFVGHEKQCQPTGTMVRLSNDTQVPIESLEEGMNVVTYDRRGGMFVRQGEVTEIVRRYYSGLLYSIIAGNKSTQCTDSHKWLVRWTNKSDEGWITYLMKQGTRYRVGQTQMFRQDGKGNFGLSERARVERAEAAWILKIHETYSDALAYEQILSVRYGLPEMVFNPPSNIKYFTQEIIDLVFNSLGDLTNNAEKCLSDHGRMLEYPIYTNIKFGDQERRGRTTIFETQACNLVSGYMAVPLSPEEITSENRTAIWSPIEVLPSKVAALPVYSLNVEKHHKYVADGIVTCNSIYGFAGADSQSIPNLRKRLEATERGLTRIPLTVTRRCGKAIVREANKIVPDFQAHESNPEGRVSYARF